MLALALLQLGEVALTVRNPSKEAHAIGHAVRCEQRHASLADRVALLWRTLCFLDLVPVECETQARLRDAFVPECVEGGVSAPTNGAGPGWRGHCGGDGEHAE